MAGKRSAATANTRQIFNLTDDVYQKMAEAMHRGGGQISARSFRDAFGMDPPSEVLDIIRREEQLQAEATRKSFAMFLRGIARGFVEEDCIYEDPDQSPVRGIEAERLNHMWGGGMDYTPSSPAFSPWALLLWRGDYTKMMAQLEGLQGSGLKRLLERRETGMYISAIGHVIQGAKTCHPSFPMVSNFASFLQGAELRHMDCLRKLVDLGAYIHIKDVAGYTPLHHCLALYRNDISLEMARLLLERGADPNAQNRFGVVPLIYSVQQGHMDSVKLLLEFKADPTVPDWEGNTPMKVAKSPRLHTLFAMHAKKRCHERRLAAKEAGELKRCCVCNSGQHAKRCSGCYLVWYCGPACQKQDWDQHKAKCKETHAQYVPLNVDKVEYYNFVAGEVKGKPPGSPPSKNHFVLKVQTKVEGEKGDPMVVYNEERSISGEITLQKNPDVFSLIHEKVRTEGLDGFKAFFYGIWDQKKKRLRINPHVVLPLEVW